MEYKEIDDLLGKYFEGESSLEDESRIQMFFMENKFLPEKYERIKEMYGFFEKSKREKSDLKIENVIPKRKKKSKIIKYAYYAVAASVALLFGIQYFTNNSNEKHVYAYINGKPVENQDVAYKEAQKALMMISKNLNDGARNVNHLSELNKVVEKISSE